MKGKGWWITASTLQTLVTLTSVAGIGVLYWLTRNPEARFGKDAADTVHGLRIGMAVLAGWTLPSLVAAYAMWKGYSWGRWLAFAFNAAVTLLMLQDPILEHEHMDADDVSVTAVFALASIVIALPWARKPAAGSAAPAPRPPLPLSV